MIKLKKYHGERVQSLMYNGQKSLSVGIMIPGEYEFGSMNKEITTVTSGKIEVWVEGSKEWHTYLQDEKFTIPEHKNFKFRTDEVSSFLCFYE